jgi:hypothetical protein
MFRKIILDIRSKNKKDSIFLDKTIWNTIPDSTYISFLSDFNFLIVDAKCDKRKKQRKPSKLEN